MTAARDPYAVLGLAPGASPAEVKRAYRRLAKVLHPDSAGERSLPAFLAVQEAYERLTGTRVRTVRPPGSAAGPAATGTRPGGGFREPWRADPDRARAAREQARARRAGASGATSGAAPGPGTADGPATSRAGAGDGTRAGSTSRDRARSGQARSWATSGSGTHEEAANAGAGGTGGSGPSTGRRRRTTRKATMGSTSYDEARDASDPRWAGASWYGPTTGEYWIVNPREYADPRKHGPGYSNRVRSGPSIAEPDAAPPETADAPSPSPGPTADRGARRRPAPDMGEASRGHPIIDASDSGTAQKSEQAPQGVDAILRAATNDPLRRIGLVLLAWAPIGIAVAGLIGDATGCSTYSTTCDGTDPFLPWVAQAVILGLLLLIPVLARVLAAGSVAIVLGLVPATAFVIAFGGARSPAAGAVLGGALALAWLVGVGWGTWRLVRPGATAGVAR